MKTCTSCNKEVVSGYIEFKCPKCSKKTIIRCEHCRQTARKYVCAACEFEGP